MEESEREDELVQKLTEEICLYQDEIKQRIFSKVGNMDDAEDLAQETLLRFLRSLKGRTEIRSPKAYLFKIADNLVNDYFNGGKKTRLVTNNSIDKDDGSSSDPLLDLESNDPDIDAYLLMKEAILALDRMTQRVIVYRAFQGLSHEEINKITGFSHRKIDDIINKGAKKIKEHLFDEIQTEGVKNG